MTAHKTESSEPVPKRILRILVPTDFSPLANVAVELYADSGYTSLITTAVSTNRYGLVSPISGVISRLSRSASATTATAAP